MAYRSLREAPWGIALALALLAGCGSDDAGAGGSGSGSGSGSGNGAGTGSGSASGGDCAPGLPSGFEATPSAFSLPAPRCDTAFDRLASSTKVRYSLLDLTFDGFGDLIIFSDACDPSVGDTHWDVYASGPTGFAGATTPYALPAPRCQESFDDAAKSGQIDYGLLDVDADGHGDLVVFRDACDPSVGKTHWDVYAGGATGFASAPSSFAIPAPRCQIPFDAAGKAGARSPMRSSTSMGTRALDLVVTADACDPTVGATHWDLYRSSGAGIAPAPVSFAIPPARCKTRFDRARVVGGRLVRCLQSTRRGDAEPRRHRGRVRPHGGDEPLGRVWLDHRRLRRGADLVRRPAAPVARHTSTRPRSRAAFATTS